MRTPDTAGSPLKLPPLTPRKRAELLRRFRLWAFYVLYRRTYRHETNSLHRFVRALLDSLQPIRDRRLYRQWCAATLARDAAAAACGLKEEVAA